MYRILLVEDAREFQLTVKMALAPLKCELKIAENAAQAEQIMASGEKLDLVLLDISLPDKDGLNIFMDMRKNNTVDVPVIFLTGRQEVEDKVLAFSLGAEDYIVKPFHMLEFKARVEAKLVKSQAMKRQGGPETLQVGNVHLNTASYRAHIEINGQKQDLALTPLEFKLFRYLSSTPEKVFSREQLLAAVWGDNVNVYDRTVDTHISSLRKKIGASNCLIKAVPGVGYRFSVTHNAKAS